MPPPRERRWPWIAAGYAVLLLGTAAITSFIHDAVAPENQPVAIRIAVALIVAVVLIHIRNHFRGDPRWDPPSGFEDALTPPPVPPKLDTEFTKLRDELANGISSRTYFEKNVWPRLCVLARARGHAVDLPPPVPALSDAAPRGARSPC